jgi:hypothetical protein
VYVWNVAARETVYEFDTTDDSGGVSVALSPDGNRCFVGAYYAWGGACVDVPKATRIWWRRDLKRFYGLASSDGGRSLTCWFDGSAGLTLSAAAGETIRRHVGLRGFYSSSHSDWSLACGRSFELLRARHLVHKFPRRSFTELSATFAFDHCILSESGAATRAVSLTSGLEEWRYEPRAGAHVIALDYCREIDRCVAIEYAYTDEARANGPMVALLHLTRAGEVTLCKPITEWSEALVFCTRGTRLLNGLGELYDVPTGEL